MVTDPAPPNQPPDEPPDETRARVLALLRRYGHNVTSFQVLEPGFRYWFFGDDAVVAYVDTGGAWVAAGAPIAATDKLRETAAAFSQAARAHKRRASFFATEPRFVQAGADVEVVHIGEQPFFDPQTWAATVQGERSLRQQLNRARNKGVVVRRATPAEVASGPLSDEIQALVASWLHGRAMAPLGFLVGVELSAFGAERAVYVAHAPLHDDENTSTLVGVLGCVPMYARRGWFFEDLLRSKHAPNGTVELLVDTAMRDVAADAAVVTLGLAPLSGTQGWLRVAKESLRSLYDFEGLRRFKAGLRPTTWEPVHLAVPRGQSTLVALADALTAFAHGGVLRYGARTLLRGPALVVRLLAAALVPWTMLLALLPSSVFLKPWVQYAWVAFDVVLAGLLFWLSRRWRQGLARALLVAICLDVVVTTVQVLTFHAPRVQTIWGALACAAAVLAPTLAAVVLGSGLRHRR